MTCSSQIGAVAASPIQPPRPTFKQELFGKTNIVHIGKRGYIEKDKFLHSTVGGFVGSSVYMYVYYKTDRVGLSLLAAVASAFVVGECKELYDKSRGGKDSFDDKMATGIAGFTGGFTKICQIGIQTENKRIAEEEKQKYQNLNIPNPILP